MATSNFDDLLTVDLREKIFTASMTDPTFLRSFLDNPRDAFRGRFGEELLPGEDLQTIDHGNGAVALYLPRFDRGLILSREIVSRGSELIEDELSDDELEMVAGGKVCDDRCNGTSFEKTP